MKIVNKISFALLSLLVSSPVMADGPDPDFVSNEPPTLSGMGAILDRIVALILPVASIVCVIFVIIGGYMWIVSAGDPAKTKQAQGTLTWAILGLVFILLITAIVTLITKLVV